MAKRKDQPNPQPNTLKVTASDAKVAIAHQIIEGEGLAEVAISSRDQLTNAYNHYELWASYSRALLDNLFSGDVFQSEFDAPLRIFFGGGSTVAEDIKDYRDDAKEKIERLRRILVRIDLLEEPAQLQHHRITLETGRFGSPPKDKVFLVFGHDELAKSKVEAFLWKINVEPILLGEKANEGKTIFEKLVKHGEVKFAVIIMTPDDLGAAKNAVEDISVLEGRARQNVVFEFGFFAGKLGREHTAVIYVSGTELPSDYRGLGYIGLDTDWQTQLMRELTAAKVNIDHGAMYR